MKIRLPLCLCALAFALGCAGMQEFFSVQTIDTARTYHASYERVWHAAIAAVAEQGLKVASVEKDSGFIQTAYKYTDRARMLEYAGAGSLQSSNYRYMVSVSVIEQGGGNVDVSVSLTAESYTADKAEDFNARKNMYWRGLNSFKFLERDILDAVSAKLPGAQVQNAPTAASR